MKVSKPVFLLEEGFFRVYDPERLPKGWDVRVVSRIGARYLAQRLAAVMPHCGYDAEASAARLTHWRERIEQSRLPENFWSEDGWRERQRLYDTALTGLKQQLGITETPE